MDSSIPAPPVIEQRTVYIAPWWHTTLLIVVLLGMSAMGAAGHAGLSHKVRMMFYISTAVMEWLIVLYIWWGLRRTGKTTIGELVGGRWKTPEQFLLDIATALGFWLVALLVLGLIAHLLGMDKMSHVEDMQHRVGSILPQGKEESGAWILLCVTAGFCEEVIFRGYFQSQFGTLLKSAWLGIVVQGLLFGGSHAYEGQTMVIIAVYGMLFGVLAHWRRTLRPGMIAHFTHDAFQGLFAQRIFEHVLKAMPK